MLTKWNTSINLVSVSTLPDIWARHVEDSAQLWSLVSQPWTHWVDLGSGGGLPGIVVAIIAKSLAPHGTITMVESDQRKSTFLRAVIRDLDLNAKVLAGRAESVEPLSADVLSARALAPLKDLLPFVMRHLKPTGEAIFPKGRTVEAEIAEAQKQWRFDFDSHTSRIAPDSVVLSVRNVSRV
ncbi:16S rRNA m(7)G-527 methyltransferase [Roseicitreum antarcticum]|uniref:Ribosomal RNA small subunit methyltransferase G n=2 Tax=Roseicitreum antarcticum TaxID=564137 RepID=A0A1H2QYF9_9RHOB|nr:16S rRNA m(7)G-527 methyltransferase [Roseicitreum antarcticum]